MPTFDFEPWQWLQLGGMGLIILLLAVVLGSIARRNRDDRRHLDALQDELEEGFRAMQSSLSQQSLGQREEQLRTLQAIGDSLAGLINRGAEQQNHLLAIWQQHADEHDRSLDVRQGRMYQLTEDGLDKFEQRMKAVDTTLDQKLAQNEARLEQVYQSLGEVHKLAEGVGDLKRVLSNVKKRGVWGEIQLGGLLSEALVSTQYAQNVQVRPHSEERVEYAVCLPGKDEGQPIYLPIDSKFPQEDYARLADASDRGDVQQTEAARKALLNAVRVEAKRISGKYIEPPYTTDFAVMFLPMESLYAEVVRNAELVEQIQREHRVVISGPSTLLAMLNSLQMGFRTLAIEKRSAELWRLLGAVRTDFGSFAQILSKTQEKLRQATDTIDTAFVRSRSIERKLRHVEALDDQEAQRILTADPQIIVPDLRETMTDEPD